MKRTPQEVLDKFPAPIEGPLPTEKAKAEIIWGCTEHIVTSIDKLRESLKDTADANTRLSQRIFWLNVILTIATATGAATAVLLFVFRK